MCFPSWFYLFLFLVFMQDSLGKICLGEPNHLQAVPSRIAAASTYLHCSGSLFLSSNSTKG
uniref:Uncharacterized protein n=1 Tax=Octopus bimaculoides TaxID=37653 RepID=A0A0L8I0C2_OCTBM